MPRAHLDWKEACEKESFFFTVEALAEELRGIEDSFFTGGREGFWSSRIVLIMCSRILRIVTLQEEAVSKERVDFSGVEKAFIQSLTILNSF